MSLTSKVRAGECGINRSAHQVGQHWYWQPIELAHAWGFAGITLCSTLGLGLITQAFRTAPASVVAPFDYTELISATLLGWMIWGALPDRWAFASAGLIAASGIYIAVRRHSPAVRLP